MSCSDVKAWLPYSRLMSLRFTGWLAAGLAMLIMLTLVVVELTDAGQRRWWAAHPLTTDTVAGLLVLLVTVLVVNQLLTRRQARQRGHAVPAQAAIMVAQAVRSTKALSSVIDGPGDRGAASDGFRTYMLMLLIGAPVLIDDPVARRFLEQAQYLGGVMARMLAATLRSPEGVDAGRRAGRRHPTAAQRRGTATSAAQSRNARFHPAHRPDRRGVGPAGAVRAPGITPAQGPGAGHALYRGVRNAPDTSTVTIPLGPRAGRLRPL